MAVCRLIWQSQIKRGYKPYAPTAHTVDPYFIETSRTMQRFLQKQMA